MREPTDVTHDHWADKAAAKTVAAHPDAELFTVAAGITPSGVVHVGNFREVMTVELVARALRDQGKQVRFIYSWDDFDVFRKVPVGMPQPEMLEENLRRSIVDVPDPFGEHDSYASHNIAVFETDLGRLGIRPEFIRQSGRYRSGDYADGIKTALEHRGEIRRILDAYRRTPLPEDWLPIAGFCAACHRDNLDLHWERGYDVSYRCGECGHEQTVDLREGGNIKLLWRIDWPMRWAHEQVLFEPGGKDHSSSGGSYDTGKQIAREVYAFDAPQYVAYDFVRIKGAGGKISSSEGNAVTLDRCLEVYEPEVLRWLFVGYRANVEFQISFDDDVVKTYADYDKLVAQAHQPDTGGKSDAKRARARRQLQLASLDHRVSQPGTEAPWVPGFKPLAEVVQSYAGDLKRTLEFFEKSGRIDGANARECLLRRAECARNWLERYAPEERRFAIRSEPKRVELDDEQRVVLARLVAALDENPGYDEQTLIPYLKTLCDDVELTPQQFFPVAYDLLIDREKGPRLTTLLATIGRDRALALLRPTLELRP